MKYNVIDIDPAMTYDPGENVIAVVEAEDADAAIAVAMHIVGADVMKNFDPEGYAKYITAYVDAIPVA